MLRKTLGTRVRYWRGRRNRTLEDLSRTTGLGVAYLSRLERGRINSTINTLERIAHALSVRVADLFLTEQQLSDGALIGETDTDGSSPAPAEHQIKVLNSGECVVTLAALDAQNALPSSMDYFNRARHEKADRILLHPTIINLSPEQRYRTVRDAVEWLRGEGYSPRVALISDSEADRFGIEVTRDLGLDAACYPTEAEAIRWLKERRR